MTPGIGADKGPRLAARVGHAQRTHAIIIVRTIKRRIAPACPLRDVAREVHAARVLIEIIVGIVVAQYTWHLPLRQALPVVN